MFRKRICIIGAGPSGMSALYQFSKLENMPDIVCYEKQETWGGLWNYSWRTGLDQYGEHSPHSMYRELWTNAPKECNVELPDYTFDDHFGQPVPSFAPRAAVRDYIEGRWTKGCSKDLKTWIRFNTVVRYVRYMDADDKFLVTKEDLTTGETGDEIFSHCIVATGIFNFPNEATFPGINSFEGRILHSHDFRDAKEFKGQIVLIIGAKHSGIDIALLCLKNLAKHVFISWRSQAPGLKWPPGIEERPPVENLGPDTAYFKDGSVEKVDSIIMCTGYKNHFPFLESRLRISSKTSLYPPRLYKGSLFIGHGNNKLFYIGVQEQLYTMVMFDSIALWVCKFILGLLRGEPKSRAEMETDGENWHERACAVTNSHEAADFQTAMLTDLCKQSGYTMEVTKVIDLIHDCIKHKQEDIANFRSHRFRSVFTQTLARVQTPFLETFDTSVENFLGSQ